LRTVGHLLELHYDGLAVVCSKDHGWHYTHNSTVHSVPRLRPRLGKVQKLFSPNVIGLKSQSGHDALYEALVQGDFSTHTEEKVIRLADQALKSWDGICWNGEKRPWFEHLDWSPSQLPLNTGQADGPGGGKESAFAPAVGSWPKWYWELCKPRRGNDAISPDISVRSRASPLLMRLKWLDFPLFFSREHGWTYRVPVAEKARLDRHQKALFFAHEADEKLRQDVLSSQYVFYKLPHKDGESGNVGTPLGKAFGKYLEDGTLSSPEDTAKRALDLNAQCSYWISARDRVVNQLVRWHGVDHDMGFKLGGTQKWGMILPQVVTMGTVTRRAIEKTWLTASNAKKDRVGSELKAMVRSPPGYVFVGADVDSEELWISSLIGDAQFGFHGSTAISWMTLEGTKAAKTDLHSKTASILGITRDAAKVFNYSRIYGAGMRHAQQLLLQNNASMGAEIAAQKAAALYAATKGKRVFDSPFGQRLWIGGSESFLFNKLEEMALAETTETPVLGCRITTALQTQHLPTGFGSDFLPSRINWAVQSSGVDYLHLLIAAMDYLIKHFQIDARYLISIHDELRYLVAEDDKYRAALALQIANLWTRCQFAFRLGMDDLPQAVAFFSAVDIDIILRKEVNMSCQTPSHNHTLPAGEALDIEAIIERTGGLCTTSPPRSTDQPSAPLPVGYCPPVILHHRASCPQLLQAQSTDQVNEVRTLALLLPNRIGRVTKDRL
jgi:DNA polymerase gamma 1